MDKKIENFVIDLMKDHNILTLATLREDGFPQANTVTFANDGLTIYFSTAQDSQKIKNIKNINKVSLTIDRDYEDWSKIKGLSMAATAEILTSPDAIKKAMDCLVKKFPFLAEMPEPEEPYAVVKISPKIISVLNYELGFGHNELIEV
ncbi:putative stress protein (General stress protein 26) [uncultured Desulfobacterium sp.]|uniref:Putative stress protein (General stress protein 26) n=1 Tax=uncultured Desulfobacterium sp. TaxID=201089 RepID=A0A445MWW3_9BACT|nr:putative stress protein (General stress protein 26) [uncultured Desulfobacterium sp.]